MKIRPTKKSFRLITKITLSLFVFFSVNSCQKETGENKPVGSSIIYTDLIPDTTQACLGTCNHHYYLDLNKDAVNDFDISVISTIPLRSFCTSNNVNTSVNVLPLNSNSVSTSKLDSNEIIGNFITWSDTIQVLRSRKPSCSADGLDFSKFMGEWSTSTDGYLSLKIEKDNHVYFGWAHLFVNHWGAYFTIKDWAYNTAPNQSILSGQTK